MSTKVRRTSKRGAGRSSMDNVEQTTSKAQEKEKQKKGNESSDEEMFEEDLEGGLRVGGVWIPPAPPAICSTENSGPRLIITHIVNENFKSYAGKQVVGPFHKSFTSIIGPNGSGKSNVIDSMLFVFGYRATKIRSKKISVLIHKSENYQTLKSCTVAVHFVQINDMEGDNFEPISGTELVIARTAFADSSSYYTINGRRAQFKDVALLLRSHGIDLVHNRFLILQGEVETIAMMKPKAQSEHDTGMLEYLEDIIGTSRYKTPIDKLAEKLVEVSEERQEKATRLKNAKKDMDNLSGPMSDAVEFLKTENKKSHTYNKLLQKQIFDSQFDLNKAENEKKTFDECMLELRGKLKSIETMRSTKEKEASAKKKELETMKSQHEKLTDAFKDVEKKAMVLGERVTQTNKQRKKAIENKKNEENKLDEFEKIPEKNTKEIEELTLVEKKLQGEIKVEEAAVEKVLASLQAETRELQETQDGLSNRLLELNNNRDEAKSKFEIAKSEMDICLSNETKEKTKYEQMKLKLKSTQERIKELGEKTECLGQKIPEADQDLNAGKSELENIRTEDAVVNQEMNRLRANLEEMKSTAQASQSHNRVLQFIMNLKHSGQIPGIFGRLGDLGGIDQKYDIAVSTACGFLDHIIVDTVDTGRDCLEALKRHNIGRANFLAIDKQEKFRSIYSRPFRAPEDVPRLFDLITVEDDRVRPSFYFALRDTIVADTLSQAKRVAYGNTRYRAVTLGGEIIEISGTMAGGGNHVTRGRMGQSAVRVNIASPSEMNAAESKLAELRERARALRERQAVLEETTTNLTRDLRNWNKEMNSFRVELRGLTEQEPVLKNQLKEQERAVVAAAPDPDTLKEKEASVKSLKKTFETALGASSKLEAEVEEINKKIEAATGGKMKAAQSKLDSVTKKRNKVVAEITKLQVAITTSTRNVKKTKDRIQSLTSDVKECEDFLKNFEVEREKLEKEGSWINEKKDKLMEETLSREIIIKEIRESLSELIKEESKLKTTKLNEDQRVDSMVKKIQELKYLLPAHKKKLNSLKLHELPNEDGDMIVETFTIFTEDEMDDIDPTQLLYKISRFDELLRGMKPNLNTIQEYKEKAILFKQRCHDLDDVTKRRNEIRKAHEDVRKSRLTEFMAGFTVISNKLKEMYQMITLGGDAEFELMDSLDPFSEGVVFSVRPPKKSWKNISNLSGGEKTLSSLALVFALHYYRPSPLYVMDEIDAALDFRNVSIVGHYIKERTKNAQFIIISLRQNMFELADVLVGIYKTHNCTKSVTITPSEYVRTVNTIEKRDSQKEAVDAPPTKISKKD